jgi:arsenite-transporting ATPase
MRIEQIERYWQGATAMARLWLFGGKGGVGKTTASAATALWLANAGFRTLVVSSDPAHSTSDSLEYPLGPEPTPVADIENLWGMELDPERTINEVLPKFSNAMAGSMGNSLTGMFTGIDSEAVQKEMDSVDASQMMIPGLDEALAFDQLLRYVEDPRFDVIIFDTAPTGHTLRFLSLPEVLETWMSRILRYYRMTGGIRMMLFGGKKQDAMKEELEKFQRRVAHVRRVLSDPELASFTLVTIPEQMAVSETERAALALDEYGITVNGVIVNRLTPDFDHPFLSARRKTEQSYLVNLRELFSGLPVAELALGESDVHGLAALEAIASQLHGELPELPEGMESSEVSQGIPISIKRGLSIVDDGSKLIVEIHLPAANKDELDLRSEDDNIIISVNGREATIPVGRKVNVKDANAKFENDILRLEVENLS